MSVYSSLDDIPAPVRGLCLALGNFDGLHRGHMAVVEAARTAAMHRHGGWALASFEPPPRRYFQPDAEPFRLTLPHRRAALAGEAGASAVFELPFNRAMASMTDGEFVEQVLHEALGASHVAIGADFRFGRGRMGDARSLQRHALGLGIGVSVVEPVSGGQDKISSTDIRMALTEGRVGDAAGLLGRYWCAEGVVEHGEKRGRHIGFPTANIRLGPLIAPRQGIYTVAVRIGGQGAWHGGVANFGRTPTTGEREPLFEAHLFDFEDDLYGQWIEAALIEWQRPELRFDGIDALVAQMHLDAASARAKLAAMPGGNWPRTALAALPRA